MKTILNQSYSDFLASKSQVGLLAGFEPIWLPDWLKPFQRHMVAESIRRGRSAMRADADGD